MFLTAKLSSLDVLASKDKKFSDFGDNRMELYQTWQLSEMTGLGAAAFSGRQGFTTINPGDMRLDAGDRRTMINDPYISHMIEPGKVVQLDVHFWESDDAESTHAVKSTFSDAALSHLLQALEAAGADEKAAKENLKSWIGDNAANIVQAGVGAVAPQLSPIVSAFDLNGLFGSLLNVAQENGDDYHGLYRIIIQTRTNGEWRMIAPTGPTQWQTGEGPLQPFHSVNVASGKIAYDAVFDVSLYGD